MVSPTFRQADEKRLIQDAVDAFEESWSSGVPQIHDHLSQANATSRRHLLLELIQVDMERRAGSSLDFSVQLYLQQFPELAAEAALLETLRSTVIRDADSVTMVVAKRGAKVEVARLPTGDRAPPPTATEQDLPADTKLGQYTIIRLLGKGGFGKVYLAKDTLLEHLVAVKVKGPRDSMPGLPADFFHEAQSVLRLSHPNIVRMLHAGTAADGRSFIVYEFVDGKTLDELITLNSFPLASRVSWIAEIADALHHAHQARIVHRDVSPKNIMVTNSGQAKLLDFGLARKDGQAFRDDYGTVLGAVHWISPEQARGTSHWATPQSDIFSLGSVLYFTITGQYPFEGKHVDDILQQIQHATPATPRSLTKDIPLELEKCCLRAMDKKPELRYSTGSDFAEDLRQALARLHAPDSLPRNSSRSLLVAAAIITTIALTLVSLNNRRSNPNAPKSVPIATPGPAISEPTRLRHVRLVVENDLGNKAISDDDLPMSIDNQVQIEWEATTASYGYVLLVDHTAKVKIVHAATEPTFSGRYAHLMQNAAGLVCFFVGITAQPLRAEQLDTLVRENALVKPIALVEAAAYKGRFNVFDEKRPLPEKYDDVPATKSDAGKIKDLEISKAFKDKMSTVFEHHYGQMFGVRLPE